MAQFLEIVLCGEAGLLDKRERYPAGECPR
jgi:hypothetical protein